MKAQREYWIETVGKTYLYYKVVAGSKRDALEKYRNGAEEYVGYADSPDQTIRGVLSEKPHVSGR